MAGLVPLTQTDASIEIFNRKDIVDPTPIYKLGVITL